MQTSRVYRYIASQMVKDVQEKHYTYIPHDAIYHISVSRKNDTMAHALLFRISHSSVAADMQMDKVYFQILLHCNVCIAYCIES